MALASASPDPPSPLKHLNTLYPLACVLVGEEAAPSLLVQVYEEVAGMPPDERPEALDDWLNLLLETAPDDTLHPSDPGASGSSASPGSSSLRHDVAERLVRNALPVVLATCSAPERLTLTLWATRSSETTDPAQLGDGSGDNPSADPSGLLRDKLHTIRSAPEAALVDETFSDADLRDALRNALYDRFSPVPSSLRARLRTTLQSASSPSSDATEKSSGRTSEPSSNTTDRLLNRLPARPQPRTLLFVLLLGALVLAGGLGGSYLTDIPSPASSPSPPGLVAFSAEQAGAATTERTIHQQAEAEAYLDSTWDRQVRLPTIDRAQLQGVGRLQAAGNTEIPVAVYTDTNNGSRVAAFIYSYALVDRLDGATTLDTQVRAQLAKRNHLVANEQSSGAGLLWRDRASIFVVVSPAFSVDTLRARVHP